MRATFAGTALACVLLIVVNQPSVAGTYNFNVGPLTYSCGDPVPGLHTILDKVQDRLMANPDVKSIISACTGTEVYYNINPNPPACTNNECNTISTLTCDDQEILKCKVVVRFSSAFVFPKLTCSLTATVSCPPP